MNNGGWHFYRYSKFYPKKVIQIDRVKLSTEISQVKKLSRRVIQKLFYPNSTLLEVQFASDQDRLIFFWTPKLNVANFIHY